MSNWAECKEHYQQALKAAHKDQRQHSQNGTYPYLQILDEILPDYQTAGEVNLGLIDIPIDKIVGTKTKGRTTAFSANFMPLLSEDSEFGLKWRNLCSAHLSDAGIRDPITCFEFLGRFYVQEGNKRVSVLKYFGSTSVFGNVIRILPAESSRPEVIAYRDFLTYYPMTKHLRSHSQKRAVFRNSRRPWDMIGIMYGRMKNGKDSSPATFIFPRPSKSLAVTNFRLPRQMRCWNG